MGDDKLWVCSTRGNNIQLVDLTAGKVETVVDVGVAYGTPALYTAFPDAYFFLFEPVAEFEPHLKSILTSVRGE